MRAVGFLATGCALLVRGEKLEHEAVEHLSAVRGPLPVAASFLSTLIYGDSEEEHDLETYLAPQCQKAGLGNGSTVWAALEATGADFKALRAQGANLTNASFLGLVLREATPGLIQKVMGTLKAEPVSPMPENTTTDLLGEIDSTGLAKLASELPNQKTMKAKITRVYKAVKPAIAARSKKGGIGGTVRLIKELTAPLSTGRRLMMVSRVIKIAHPNLEWLLAVIALVVIFVSKRNRNEKIVLALCVLFAPTPLFEPLVLVIIGVLVCNELKQTSPSAKPVGPQHTSPSAKPVGCCAKRSAPTPSTKPAIQRANTNVKPVANGKHTLERKKTT
jgi:hypothetical protein